MDPHLSPEGKIPPMMLRWAGWCAGLSARVCIAGIILIVAFYVAYLGWGDGMGLGRLNDVAVVIQYVLMIPVALALHVLAGDRARRRDVLWTVVGVSGMILVIVLQTLLIAGAMTFRHQIIWVVPAFLIVLAWFVRTGRRMRGYEIVPDSLLVNALAGLYVGYPFWGFRVARSLLARARRPAAGDPWGSGDAARR